MGFFRDPVRKDWKYQFQFQGKNYSGRGFKTKLEARIARADHQKRIKTESIRATAGMGFKEAAYLYLDDARRRFVPKTYKGKAYAVKSFYKHLGEPEIAAAAITPQMIESYLVTRPSNHNFNVHRKELHALFTYCRRVLRIIDYNPVWDIEKMPHTPARKKIPTEAQVLQLIVAADPEIERPLFMVVLLTLARIDEVLRLTWDDINFETRTVTLWTRKRKGGSYEADPVPMNDDLYDILWRLYQGRSQSDWVFFNEKTGRRYRARPKFMRGLCKRAFAPEVKKIADYTGPRFGFHALRHFMASYLADREKRSTKTLQRLLRHKEQRTTEIYLHSVDESIRAAMDGLRGRFLVSAHGIGSGEKEAKKPIPAANRTE